jgi:hypothetical protein
MTEQHPMVPSSEELKQWEDNWFDEKEHPDVLLIRAYQAGADQELEACCEWLDDTDCDDPQETAKHLRAARRPKPPSLKEQALALVEQHEEGWRPSPKDWDTIRRALEALDD